jgi:hypothetical protein
MDEVAQWSNFQAQPIGMVPVAANGHCATAIAQVAQWSQRAGALPVKGVVDSGI